MKKKLTIQQIVLQEYPGANVTQTTDAGTSTSRTASVGMHKARPIADLKRRHGVNPQPPSSVVDTAAARRRAVAAKPHAPTGPSGVVTILPKSADGGARRYAKEVIVSNGKVIALRG